MSTSQSLLRAEDLAVGYGRRAVVEGVTFEVADGDFWFLLGPNGSGKTTLARTVLGLLRPLAGRLRYEGGLERTRVGFVPQHLALRPSLAMTLAEFIDLGFAGETVARSEAASAVAWAAASVGLSDRLESDVHALSGGLRQRAMVARALVRRPRLLVLDEPTANLDPSAEEALLSALAGLRRETSLALLFVCHDVAVAARYSTHVGFFHDGMFEAGTRERLFDAGVLRRTYGLDICVSLDAKGHPALHVESGRTPA